MAEKQLIDGAWYWVRFETGFKDDWTQAPGMYRSGGDAWYSFLFTGIPTRQVEVLGKIDAPSPAEPAASATQAGAANPAATPERKTYPVPGGHSWCLSLDQLRGLIAHLQENVSAYAFDDPDEQPELVLTFSPAGRVSSDDGSLNATPVLTLHDAEYPDEGVYSIDPLTCIPPAPAAVEGALAMAETWEQSAADTEQQRGGVGPDYNQGIAEGMRICAKDLRAALAATPAAKAEVQTEKVTVAEPSDKELIEFAVEEEFILFCSEDEFIDIARAVLHRFGNKAGQSQTEVQAEPVAQWQKRHPIETEGRWQNTQNGDAQWWRDNSPGWEARALYTAPQATQPADALDAKRLGDRLPMQPVIVSPDTGVYRFKENRIVTKLVSHSECTGYSLNEIARDFNQGMYSADEQMQLWQLIGYSVDGYGTLSYVTDESYERAAAMAAAQKGGDAAKEA